MSIAGITSVLPAVMAVALVISAGCSRGAPGQSEEPQQTQSVPPAAGSQFDIALDTGGPLRMNAAPLAVRVRENGTPATGVDVSVEFRMPPSGAMGEMRTGAELEPAGEGHYRGEVDMTMAGDWIAIVRVSRHGAVVATHTQAVKAE